jgi:hypothetical protein
MKLSGCAAWSSLSLSLSDLTETLLNWVGEVRTLWSPLLRFKQPQQENTNWRPSFLQQQGGGGGEIWLGTKIQGKLPDSLTSTKLKRRASHTEANKKDQSKKLKNNIPAAKKKTFGHRQ